MKKSIIKHAHLVDGSILDILIADGKIQKVGSDLWEEDAEIIETAQDVYVSAGWIDMHTHCFAKYDLYGDDADSVGYQQGVTTVVDAGTAGSDTMAEFYAQAKQAKTHVLSFINIAKQGICAQNELADLANLDMDALHEAIQTYPNFIVGLKARMSKSVLQDSGIQPLDIAIAQGEKEQLPVMVHVGNEPARLEDVMSRVRPGDIVTHIFNPKKNGILDEHHQVKAFVKTAHEQGVWFDLGHGTESFSFDTCVYAHDQHVHCDSISTDIYFHNRKHGPVYSLALTMSKMMELGYSLPDVIEKVTTAPAKALRQHNIGVLTPGARADITFFKIEDTTCEVQDSSGKTKTLHKVIQPCGVMVEGVYYALPKEA